MYHLPNSPLQHSVSQCIVVNHWESLHMLVPDQVVQDPTQIVLGKTIIPRHYSLNHCSDTNQRHRPVAILHRPCWVSRRKNTVKACEKHEAIDGLFAEIQLTVWEICCQKLLGGSSGLVEKWTDKGKKHDFYACSGTSQSNHPHRCLQVIHSTV